MSKAGSWWRTVACLLLLGVGAYGVSCSFGSDRDDSDQNGLSSGEGASAASGPIAAFPGAEGFGASTRGGRGGRVLEVTNLNDSGRGSLRACVEASGPRTCVFRTGGTIVLGSALTITNPYLTIAGQTAPGDGITLKAADVTDKSGIYIKTYEVIIRYIRIRPGTEVADSRALSINAGQNVRVDDLAHNVVVDHTSLSWAGDEILIAWGQTHDITVQWSILAESLPAKLSGSTGLKGPNFGNERGGGPYSLHHNLLAHHTQRNIQVSATGGPMDVVNNVVYNMGGAGSGVKNGAEVNFVGNYIKTGPNTRIKTFVKDMGAGGYYLRDNVIHGEIGEFAPTTSLSSTRYPAPHVTTEAPNKAYQEVLKEAGAVHGLACDGSFFYRPDAVDARIVESVRAGTRGHDLPPDQTHKGLGYISTPEDVGGWPPLESGAPCSDSDHDGMSDTWEEMHFGTLERGSAMDSSGDYDGDGYTDLEEFLNGTDPQNGE